MAIRCGIDLGTTYSAISFFETYNNRVGRIDLNSADGANIIRSAVYYPDQNQSPVVGETAINAAKKFPERVIVGIKRSMGTDFKTTPIDGVRYTPQQVSAEILKTVVKDAEMFLGEEVKEVVITVPAYFGDNERAATEEAGKLVGLNVVALLPEPHAAALAYCIEKVTDIENKYLLVYDLGGGTFDVTLIHTTRKDDTDNKIKLDIKTLCKDGNASLGGLDWDRALAEIVAEKVMQQYQVDVWADPKNEAVLLENCEKAKRHLSRDISVSVIADLANHEVEVTTSEFEDRTRDLLLQTQMLLEQVVEDAEKQHNISKDQIEIMLAGGSIKMPMVPKMIEGVMGKPPFRHGNPELLVTMGAAYWAHLLAGDTVVVLDKDDQGMDELRRLAQTSCQVDNTLADRFLKDYMDSRNLKKDKGLILIDMVENFTADSELGRISLNWRLPKANFERVEIVREIESPVNGKKTSKETKPIYQGMATSFVDTSAIAGTRYIYHAYSFNQGEKSTSSVSVSAVCLGEVLNPKAEWENGRVNITWELPGKGASVIVFRRKDAAPSVHQGMATNAVTEQVYRGAGTSLQDTKIDEGETYHYRIVVDFGNGLLTQGKDVQVTIPKAPPDVSSLTASYNHQQGKDVVLLKWEKVGKQNVKYVVVRREGNVAPCRVSEGTVIVETGQTAYLDEKVIPGCRYIYAVFTKAGELYSHKGTASPPVNIVAEVSGLEATTGDGTVQLKWKTPANVSRVLICRSLNPPQNYKDGTIVPLTGEGHAQDTGLRNNLGYNYLVCCVYRPDGIDEIVSCGIRISAIPVRLPDPVQDFNVRAEGKQIACSWKPLDYGGKVVVLSSAQPHNLVLGQRLNTDELRRLEEKLATNRIIVNQDRSADDVNPDPEKPYYSVFTVAGQHVVAGGTGACVICPDVTDLSLSSTQNGVILRWVWPKDCPAVMVVCSTNTYPQGPEDPNVRCIYVTRTEYKSAGEKFVHSISEARGRIYYAVYAQAFGGRKQFFSPGTESTCRAEIQWGPWMTLRYRLSPGQKIHKGKEMLLSWSIEDPFSDFGGFMLRANNSGVPSSQNDGIELFRWIPEKNQIAGNHEIWISLEPVQKKQWTHFFCKAMAVDPAHQHSTLIIHPNTCIPISSKGEMHSLSTFRVKLKHFRAPRKITCPYHFEKFPIKEMLFTTYNGDKPIKGKYSWLDWLMGKPPQPPIDKQGKRYPLKVCPNEECKDKKLPYTAGNQESLVIGIIGAKFSGKSHYIASMIQRLESQVGADFNASLLPVSDETSNRYKNEFYNYLQNNFEIPTTIGTPLPLIYDLSIAFPGSNEIRAVTLALYDTAGENFNNENTVNEIMQYLQVASGIIFLIDPLQWSSVREVTPKSVNLPDSDKMADPNTIISRVLIELQNRKVIKEGGRLSIPVAVVLTKCDVLCTAGWIEKNRLWNTDARHIGSFDLEIHNDMAGMMSEYLQKWDHGAQATYNTVKGRFSKYAFFGTSATGCASDPTTRQYKYVSPWRVEDPLLWLLAELGVIPVKNG